MSEGEGENARILLRRNSLNDRAAALVTFPIAYPIALMPGVRPGMTPDEQAAKTDIVFLGAFRPVRAPVWAINVASLSGLCPAVSLSEHLTSCIPSLRSPLLPSCCSRLRAT